MMANDTLVKKPVANTSVALFGDDLDKGFENMTQLQWQYHKKRQNCANITKVPGVVSYYFWPGLLLYNRRVWIGRVG